LENGVTGNHTASVPMDRLDGAVLQCGRGKWGVDVTGGSRDYSESVARSQNPNDAKTGRFALMVAAQSLQVLTPDDSLARLRVVTDRVVSRRYRAPHPDRPLPKQTSDSPVPRGSPPPWVPPVTGSFPFCSCQPAWRDDARDAMTCAGHILEKSANPGMPVAGTDVLNLCRV
jgi:hypothetical protein